ncbi:Nif3-like dinuclear metal center hexameric protein [Tepidicella xavieri]|uniref:Dinuclear metal center YbgI/SA1388 family protein n=1 Tax=Tepidicella xavieri TaxID=360241 RepID=A0A4R6UA13_9BURK|nr:Nif3-like dinuclear metal center hexameric protein [Tepidicella xavieri]TDQ43341.1 dinuclear metal center YbgI/SA1388 family protein [Tepidicella xavieri]
MSSAHDWAADPPPVHRDALRARLDELLQPERFRDYGPNGLQVEGRAEVRRLVTGVTASRALIEQAIDAGADAILVHHGLFWRGQSGCVTGWMKQRLGLLLKHDVSLLAYHLPLDAHATLGNNAQLGEVLGFAPGPEGWAHFGEQALGFIGAADFLDACALAAHVQARLGRPVTCIDAPGRPIRRVGWCTGGAQGYFEAAIEAGVDAFITGELSEPQTHYARECGVAFLACGHHATERYGAPAVGAWVAQQLGIEHRFIEVDNPA